MRLQLSPGVHAVPVADDLVFLSVPDDAYACLPALASAVRLDAEGAAWVTDAALADLLLASGLVRRAAAAGDRPGPGGRPVLQRPTATAMVFEPPAGAHARHLALAAGAAADMVLAYRGRSLAQLIDWARRTAPPSRGRPSERLLAETRAFQAWAPWTPGWGKCLLRSFLLLRRLRRRGLDAWWVFGVRTWPFAAHCWLQAEDVALDELPERIAAFEPILAV